jgi:hypothetical protein
MNSTKIISKLMLTVSLSFIFTINLQSQSNTVLSTYLEIKDALVQTNSKNASLAASEMVRTLEGKTDELSKKLRVDATAISNSSEMKMQRKYFDALSQNVYEYVKETGEKEGTVYKQFCPMAFNNTGAFWLAAEKEINNPYFGNMMLHCGSVKEEL